MKRMLKKLVGLSVIAACASGCEQPRADCTTGHGGFAARYTLKPGSKQGTGTCDALKGEIVGLEKYNPSQAEPNKQDLTKARLRIRAESIGTLAALAEQEMVSLEGQPLDSVGDFVSTTPDDNNVCSVPLLSDAVLEVSAAGALPAADLKYTWRNVRIHVTTAYPGTQMAADLEYTEGECTASYSVLALWPAVSCEVTDAEGNRTADPTLCDPVADPAAGRATGSGINPDFKDRIACDPDTFLCVLTAPPEGL